MTDTPASLLIVDNDCDVAQMLAREPRARGYRVGTVMAANEAVALVRRDVYDALLVDLTPGADTAFELLSQVRRLSSDTEVIVMSDRTAMAATIQWFVGSSIPSSRPATSAKVPDSD